MEPRPVILEGSQRPFMACDAVEAPELAAAVWHFMQNDRAEENAGRLGAVNVQQIDCAGGGDEPHTQKLVFNEAFDPQRAKTLITQLGATKYVEREAAQDKLMRMGEPVLPLLADAQTKTKDIEIQVRAHSTIDKIKSGMQRNIAIDVLETFEDNNESWKGILRHAGKKLIDDKDLPVAIDNDGEAVVPGPHILPGQLKTVPTKEEQEQFDKLVKEFDAVPDLKLVLEDAKKRAAAFDATPRERAEYSELVQLDWAKKEARLDYALALSESKDPIDLKKGERLLVEELKRLDHKLNPDENTEILLLALALRANQSPDFLRALKESGGNTDRLLDLRANK